MKRAAASETYEAMRRAFRDLTDVETDGAATRARVLAGAGRDVARRNQLRRIALPIAAAVIATGSVSAALAVVHRWRAPAPAAIDLAADASAVTTAVTVTVTNLGTSARPGDGRAVRIIPPATIATVGDIAAIGRRPRSLASVTDDETRAYARAHQAHVTDDAPARALDAWDAYLAAFPRGAFAPEAAYNRAICLVRLERRAEAARVLHRLAAAPPGGYRREEALRLLDWLGAAQPN
jgi:TolA-binding protein